MILSPREKILIVSNKEPGGKRKEEGSSSLDKNTFLIIFDKETASKRGSGLETY